MYLFNRASAVSESHLPSLVTFWEQAQLLPSQKEQAKQGVALIGRNTTGPPRAAPW